MKYLLTFTFVLFAISATAQETSRSYEASLDHFAVSYNHSPDGIMYASLNAGRKDNTYASASVSVRPFMIKSKLFDFISIEPFAFFEYGYNGDTFNNYGFGATHKITDSISISGKYSSWGATASITIY